MANATKGTVLYCDTTGTLFDGNRLRISGIKYIGNTSGTATLKAGGSGGTLVWQESGTSNVFNGELEAVVDDAYITITNGAIVYIYLCVD